MSIPARRTLSLMLPLLGVAAALLSLGWAPPLYRGRCLLALEPAQPGASAEALTPEILWSARGREALAALLTPAGSVQGAGTEATGEPAASSASVVEVYLTHLSWSALEETSRFELRFDSSDPEAAATGANTAAGALALLLSPAPESEETLRTRLRTLEAEIERLASDEDIDLSLIRERRAAVQQGLKDLTEQYRRARAARLDLEARWNALQQSESQALPDTVDSPQLEALRAERSRLEQRRDQLAARFGPQWPEMKELAAQIQTLDALMVEELRRLSAEAMQGAETDYRQALAQEHAQERSLRVQREEIRALEDRERLKQERESRLQELHDERAALQARLQAPPAARSIAARVQVIQPAASPAPPRGLSAPGRLAAGASLGLLLGLAWLRLAGRLDPIVSTPAEAESALEAPLLAFLPEIPGGLPPGLLRLEGAPPPGAEGPVDPIAAAARGFRDLRTGLLLARGGEPARVLLVTACRRSEGKTFVACHLAVALARRGGRVLLIDAHLRRPRAHRPFEAPPGPGLVDVLAGTVQLEEAVRPTDEPGLFLLPAGDVNGASAGLLDAASLRHLRDRLLQPARFQHLVIDAGDMCAPAAPERLAVACTGILLVVRARRSARQTLRQATATLRRHGAPYLAGVWIGPESVLGARPRAGELEGVGVVSFTAPAAVEAPEPGAGAVAHLELDGRAPEKTDPRARQAEAAAAEPAEGTPLDPEVVRRLERLRDRLGRQRGT